MSHSACSVDGRYVFASHRNLGGMYVVYFVTAAFFLQETKGKTLEEIEQHFECH